MIFLGTFLILQWFNPADEIAPAELGPISIETQKNNYAIAKDVKVILNNNTQEVLEVEVNCPTDVLTVEKYEGESFVEIEKPFETCESGTKELRPGKKHTYNLQNYAYTFFGETGRYRIQAKSSELTATSPEFMVKEAGLITRLWRSVIYQPMLNALVAVLAYMPNHNLALSVVLLTLIIRTLLLFPSQKAMKAQKRMQEVQPELERLKEKYKDDQARLAQETMLVWKNKNVHPLSSCLPMLIQIPVLLALFYTIQGGLTPDKASLIYDFTPSFSLAEINPVLFGFDLTTRSLILFPIIIGGLQFTQMQLMSARNKKKTDSKAAGMAKEMQQANNMMKYMMPLMIAFFTSQMPAAVGLYWGTSTLYGILQQLVVNRSTNGEIQSNLDDEVKVRVINKSTQQTSPKKKSKKRKK